MKPPMKSPAPPPTIKVSDEQVWLQAFLHVAGASNSTNVYAAERWADHCLVAFKERFRK